MVSIEKKQQSQQSSKVATLPVVLISFSLFAVLVWMFEDDVHPVSATSYKSPNIPRALVSLEAKFDAKGNTDIKPSNSIAGTEVTCPYQRIGDLKEEERHPTKGTRHMVNPPEGGLLHLVCCQTTKGPLNMLVHEKWAPRGAKRFLEMVQTGYFNAGVPLMRCLKSFICQFGLNNNPKLSAVFKETIPDDPNWLPQGPKHRTNEKGVARFAIGYLAYAGGGKDTRDNQLIVSLDNVPTLAGGSPWEVPWGELVGKHSFETLAKFYTGYGEDGPQQGSMWSKGVTDKVRKKFPEMDYIEACSVLDQDIQVIDK